MKNDPQRRAARWKQILDFLDRIWRRRKAVADVSELQAASAGDAGDVVVCATQFAIVIEVGGESRRATGCQAGPARGGDPLPGDILR